MHATWQPQLRHGEAVASVLWQLRGHAQTQTPVSRRVNQEALSVPNNAQPPTLAPTPLPMLQPPGLTEA